MFIDDVEEVEDPGVSDPPPVPNPDANPSDGTIWNEKNFPWPYYEEWDES